MKFLVGTSGYGYKEWKGSFYPEKLPAKKMLEYYGEQFDTVELNNTFRRMPTTASLEALLENVSASFRFAVKAPQSITHFKRLKSADADLEELLGATQALGKRRGPVLFQLPPNFKKDMERLNTFLQLLEKNVKAAFEFRHESWYDDEVYESLRKYSCVLCTADAEDTPEAKLVQTTDWGYVRLRRNGYTTKELKAWVKEIQSQDWKEVYVYFKHEETGMGPKLGAKFLKLAAK
jgi:uncharacterized protein YecE (DUF72 family)